MGVAANRQVHQIAHEHRRLGVGQFLAHAAIGDDMTIRYAYEFSDISGCGPGHGEPLSSVVWAMEDEGILHLNADCFFAAVDVGTDKVVWQSFEITHQLPSANFATHAGLLFTGLGIPGRTSVVAIDLSTGLVLQESEVDSAPQYLIVKDEKLYVRTADDEHVFELLED